MRIYESEELKRLLRVYLSREEKGKTPIQPKSYDKVEISREGEILSRIFRAMSSIEEPEISERLNMLKREIEEGKYSINEEELAKRILSGEVPEDIIKLWLGE